jgi:hypothetical protein
LLLIQLFGLHVGVGVGSIDGASELHALTIFKVEGPALKMVTSCNSEMPEIKTTQHEKNLRAESK